MAEINAKAGIPEANLTKNTEKSEDKNVLNPGTSSSSVMKLRRKTMEICDNASGSVVKPTMKKLDISDSTGSAMKLRARKLSSTGIVSGSIRKCMVNKSDNASTSVGKNKEKTRVGSVSIIDAKATIQANTPVAGPKDTSSDSGMEIRAKKLDSSTSGLSSTVTKLGNPSNTVGPLKNPRSTNWANAANASSSVMTSAQNLDNLTNVLEPAIKHRVTELLNTGKLSISPVKRECKFLNTRNVSATFEQPKVKKVMNTSASFVKPRAARLGNASTVERMTRKLFNTGTASGEQPSSKNVTSKSDVSVSFVEANPTDVDNTGNASVFLARPGTKILNKMKNKSTVNRQETQLTSISDASSPTVEHTMTTFPNTGTASAYFAESMPMDGTGHVVEPKVITLDKTGKISGFIIDTRASQLHNAGGVSVSFAEPKVIRLDRGNASTSAVKRVTTRSINTGNASAPFMTPTAKNVADRGNASMSFVKPQATKLGSSSISAVQRVTTKSVISGGSSAPFVRPTAKNVADRCNASVSFVKPQATKLGSSSISAVQRVTTKSVISGGSSAPFVRPTAKNVAGKGNASVSFMEPQVTNLGSPSISAVGGVTTKSVNSVNASATFLTPMTKNIPRKGRASVSTKFGHASMLALERAKANTRNPSATFVKPMKRNVASNVSARYAKPKITKLRNASGCFIKATPKKLDNSSNVPFSFDKPNAGSSSTLGSFGIIEPQTVIPKAKYEDWKSNVEAKTTKLDNDSGSTVVPQTKNLDNIGLASDSSGNEGSDREIEECELRRNVCKSTLSNLKVQFMILREQLYLERISEHNRTLKEIKDGTHEELKEGVEKLANEKKTRIELAEQRRKFIKQSITHKYEAEKLAARQDFENDKSMLLESMKNELLEQLEELNAERNEQVLKARAEARARPGGSGLGQKGDVKAGRSDGDEQRCPPVPVSGPYIVYRLTDEEIDEDLEVIRKALAKADSGTLL